MAVGVVACSTTSQFPMDDAYYRPVQETVLPTQPTQTTETTQTTQTTETTPKMEILHQQDTTITVRIRK